MVPVPKIVDHETRRRELARAAMRVIGREGLEQASTRAIATEAGWTTGVLQHYFATKDDVLIAVLRELETESTEAFMAAQADRTGRAAIEAAAEAMIGTDDDSARVWIAFMARACVDVNTSRQWRRAERSWRERWATLVRRGQEDGSIAPHLDPTTMGATILAIVNGLRVSAVLGSATDVRHSLAALSALYTGELHTR